MTLSKHLKRFNATRCNNVLIKHLQDIVDEEKMKELKAPGQIILVNVRLNLGILEENAVKSMSSEIREILELLWRERYKEKLKLKSQRKYLGAGRKMQQVENEKTDVDNEMQEIEEPEAMKLDFENFKTNEKGQLTMAAEEVIRGYKQDMTLLNVDIASWKIGEKMKKTYDVVVRKSVQEFMLCGCLNSGTNTSAAARSRFEKYCSRLRRLKEPIRVKDSNGVKHRVTHACMVRIKIRFERKRVYDFGEVEVLLLNELEE
eukprot:augustus_masked-scaffold_70-processed-gene-0.90-mRNA-1 protein AED:1.00 eAED:1.00 QI:0/0/0/0/1/1/2/0/259